MGSSHSSTRLITNSLHRVKIRRVGGFSQGSHLPKPCKSTMIDSHWELYVAYIDKCVRDNWANDIDPAHYGMEWNHFLPKCIFGDWPIGHWLTKKQHAIASALQTLVFKKNCMFGWHKYHLPENLLILAWPFYCEQAKKNAAVGGAKAVEMGVGVCGFAREDRVRYGKMATPKSGEANGMFGRSHTDGAKQVQKEAAIRQNQSYTQEQKQEIAEKKREASIKTHANRDEGDKKEIYNKVSKALIGRKRYVNAKGERLYQHENPGPGWQRGIKWQQHD